MILLYNILCKKSLKHLQSDLCFLNLQPENVLEEKDDAAVGYIFTLQNGTPRNNSYRGVLICALFRSILPRCRRVLYPTFEEN